MRLYYTNYYDQDKDASSNTQKEVMKLIYQIGLQLLPHLRLRQSVADVLF